MNFQDVQVGQQVVRTKGGYVVGRIGEVIEKNEDSRRVRVKWDGNPRTWVAVDAIEPTFIPYQIISANYDPNGNRTSWPIYMKK